MGRGTAGRTNVLDASGANGAGPCAASQANEDACSLNVVPGDDALNPRVAAGTMTAGQPTVPWIVFEESNTSGRHGIFEPATVIIQLLKRNKVVRETTVSQSSAGAFSAASAANTPAGSVRKRVRT